MGEGRLSKFNMSISIGAQSFPTKAAAERYIRELFERNRPVANDTKQLDHKDHAFAMDLLEMHPNKNIVCGTGVSASFCQRLDDGAMRFLILRSDGTYWDFSWRNCINPPSPERYLSAILRLDIQHQIDSFREKLRFPLICPVSGDQVSSTNCHIDHAEPNTFAAISEKWQISENLDPATVEYAHKAAYGGRASLKDTDLKRRWQIFHAAEATLRAVSRRANLSLLRKGK